MPVTIRFDPSVNSLQARVIDDATPNNDGVMTKEQAAKLAGIVPGAGVHTEAPITGDGSLGNPIAITPATEMAAGSMSAADKTKLDGLTPPGNLPIFNNTTRPSAVASGVGFAGYNTDGSILNLSDGTDWRDDQGNLV